MIESRSPEARVVAIGEDVEGLDPISVGSLADCAMTISEMAPDQQAGVCIWTEQRIYTAEEALALLTD